MSLAKSKIALPLILLLLASGCSGANEELASFKDGRIIRKELRLLMEASGADGEAASIEVQDKTLQNIAFIQLAAREGQTKDNASAALNEAEALLAAASIYLKRKEEEASFKMASYQFLYLGKSQGADRSDEARKMLTELNDPGKSDQDIEDIIYNKNEKGRYRLLGGYLDPHCVSCKPDPLDFLSPALKAESRKFTLIDNQDGFWLTRVIKEADVAGDDLKDAFEEYHRKTTRVALRHSAKLPEEQQKKMRESLMNEDMIEDLASRQAVAQLRRGASAGIQNRIQDLKEKHNFKFFDFAPGKINEDTELFALDGKSFQFKELAGYLPLPDAPEAQQLQILHSIVIPARLIEQDPELAGLKSSDDYKFLLDLKTSEARARKYFMEKLKDVSVSDEDIRENYDLKKNTQYKDRSFASAKKEIEGMLRQSRAEEARKKLQDELAKKYELRIHRDRLKAGEL